MPTPDPAEHVANKRRGILKRCLSWRRMIAKGGTTTLDGDFYGPNDIRDALKRDQVLLLKYRIMRVTGHYPSSDN